MTPSILKRLFSYIAKHKKYLYLAAGIAFFQVGFTILGPFLIGHIVDNLVGVGAVNFPNVAKYLLYFMIVAALASGAGILLNYNTNKLSYFTVQDLRNDLMQKINKLPISTIDTKPHGELISIMVADIELIAAGLLQGGSQFLTGILTIIGTIALMFYTQFNITILVLLLTPLSLAVAQFIAKRVYTRFQAQSKIRGELSGFVEEMVGNEALIKNLAYEESAQQRFNEINTRLQDKGWRAHFYSASINPSTRVVNNIIYTAVAVYGAFLVRDQMLTIGALSAFLSYANQYMKPFNEISTVMAELQSALASSSRVFQILDLPNEPEDNVTLAPLTNVQGKVEMRHVEFSYVPSKPFIQDLNFVAQPGQTIAIVGPTGCGKTTLINLLMRFYELTGGQILIDDVPSTDLSKENLRKQFGMVLQDSWIFTGTVRDNIAYGNPDASMADVVAAAKKAQIHHMIKQLPLGYETVLSSKRELLSQGQMQLLCIARMMLLDPPILILDEATSNIDTRTEIAIQETFQTMMQGRTSFIIAHRLSTIQNADVILVMRDGAIIEQGNHEQLLAANGFYATLFNSQFTNEE